MTRGQRKFLNAVVGGLTEATVEDWIAVEPHDLPVTLEALARRGYLELEEGRYRVTAEGLAALPFYSIDTQDLDVRGTLRVVCGK